jgi:hypothetical protein
VTRAEAAEQQLRTPDTAAIWSLAVPAVIRLRRAGWLVFMRGGHAGHGTAEAAAGALVAGEHRGGIPAGLS